MTSPQLEPSAHAPCTSTTLRAAAGPAACADASAARSKSIAESILTANVIHFHSVFICRAPVRCVELPCFRCRGVHSLPAASGGERPAGLSPRTLAQARRVGAPAPGDLQPERRAVSALAGLLSDPSRNRRWPDFPFRRR